MNNHERVIIICSCGTPIESNESHNGKKSGVIKKPLSCWKCKTRLSLDMKALCKK